MNIPMQSRKRIETGRSQRDGMALLFVVSLILFITLLGASFVIVSTQFSSSAKTHARLEARGDSSRSYVYRAFYDLLRGPELANVNHPLLCQDILSDQYGYGFAGLVANAADASAATGIPGTIEFTLITANGVGPGGGPLNFGADPILEVAAFFNGQVLTFTNGELRGTSVRIIGYSGSELGAATGLPYSFLVYQTQSNNTIAMPNVLDGDRIVVNGRAFSGWGGGGPNAGAGANVLAAAALTPYLAQAGVSPFLYSSTGVNESFDALDFQNMFLAGIDPIGGFVASFEKQDLYDYQFALGAAAGTNFRAFGTPGGPATLHVDNDGDGNLDSIWIDMGYPVQTDINGRRYKPLAAILVLDMDGRLNVNAHGNPYQADVDSLTGVAGPDGLPDVRGGNLPLLGAFNSLPPGSMIADFGFSGPPRGQFLGPPEVNLAPAFGIGNGLRDLLRSRYGADWDPGIELVRDSWATVSLYGHPDGTISFNSNRFVGGYYGSAMDVMGRFGVGIPNVPNGNNPLDRPALDLITNLLGNDITDSPYEFSLVDQSRYPTGGVLSDDRPFTPKEIERFLRRYDRDGNMLPSRLWDIAPTPLALRNIVTSDSWEVPALPTFEPVLALGELPGQPVSIPQRVYNLLLANGVAPPMANGFMEDLVSFDLRMGLPFDINRPFGNSSDENGNGTYDESSYTVALSMDPSVNETNAETVTTVNGVNSFDGNGDGVSNANDFLSRYQFAKNLYVLALLATGDTGAAPPVPARLDYELIADVDTLRRIALAQWVINVVDFRDSDSISTPFEIDFNPFDGWQPDGDPSTADTSFLVWGVERPELLISEGMATHDRRTQDLASIGPGTTPTDPDFDSQLVPRAAAFFELYHPWNQNNDNQLLPAELTDVSGAGIDLQRVTSAGDPVWRLVAVREAGINENPERVDFSEVDIARRIYFVEPNIADVRGDSFGSGPAFAGNKVYFPSPAVASDGVVTPGGYALIGSGGVGSGASAGQTFFGRRSDDPTLLGTTRNINLDNATRQVVVYDPVAGTSTRTDIVAIPIDQHYDSAIMAAAPRSLGLSDPDSGYPGIKTVGLDGLAFVTGIDMPVDADPAIQQPNDIVATRTDGTTDSYREMFLQRLANPLAPWDPISNPYLTIDSKTVDLTAFNGVEPDSADGVTAGDMVFASSERGRLEDPLYASPLPFQLRRRLWPVEEPTSNTPAVAALPEFLTEAGVDNHVHSFELHESFGLLNYAYTDQAPRPASELTTGPNPPLGFVNLPFNNRPFSSQMDLLDVAYTDSRDLLYLFSYDPFNSAPDPYAGPTANPRFGHLLNFFMPNEPAPGPLPSGMAALFDYVRVPSRFAGTTIHLNDATTVFAPFNILSRYREPGKININSLYDVRVREGWLGEFSRAVGVDGQNVDGSAQTYGIAAFPTAEFENSRRIPPLDPPGTHPTRFDNPIRFANDYNKVPLDILVARDGATEAPVMVTTLRNDPNSAVTAPLLDVQSDLPSSHSLRDSWARHQAFRKIGNTTTTRSSVFSIWITIGKFEVDENGVLALDGAGNGFEIGAASGRTERSRGFFMIDRSIPVAYEPGKNHNIENMILVETIIK